MKGIIAGEYFISAAEGILLSIETGSYLICTTAEMIGERKEKVSNWAEDVGSKCTT